jgi:hypothetical protein
MDSAKELFDPESRPNPERFFWDQKKQLDVVDKLIYLDIYQVL